MSIELLTDNHRESVLNALGEVSKESILLHHLSKSNQHIG